MLNTNDTNITLANLTRTKKRVLAMYNLSNTSLLPVDQYYLTINYLLYNYLQLNKL